ncbi:MAG: hypothetical protein HY819_20165 [Acidobacteria bacterium]|nr:hypothetical protein [Acidobacteriota bacterium]
MKLIKPLIFCLIFLGFLSSTFITPPSQAAKTFQNNEDKKKEDKDKKEDKKKSDRDKKIEKLTAEELAEIVLLAYGGRNELQQVRTTGIEEGTIKLANEDKDIEGRITKRFSRKSPDAQDLTRIDVKLPNQEITFGFNGFTVWAARDGVGFTPDPSAEKSFSASLVHNYESLLRYKELGGTLERAGIEFIVGIENLLLDLTHKNGAKTRYFISSKSYRILHLEYEVMLSDDKPTKFRESFFDFRPIQNTIVPAKSVLYENGRFIQEILFTQIRYHSPITEETFIKY